MPGFYSKNHPKLTTNLPFRLADFQDLNENDPYLKDLLLYSRIVHGHDFWGLCEPGPRLLGEHDGSLADAVLMERQFPTL